MFSFHLLRVPNKRTGRLLENEKKSRLYALIQTYTLINFQQKVPPILLLFLKKFPTYIFIQNRRLFGTLEYLTPNLYYLAELQ